MFAMTVWNLTKTVLLFYVIGGLGISLIVVAATFLGIGLRYAASVFDIPLDLFETVVLIGREATSEIFSCRSGLSRMRRTWLNVEDGWLDLRLEHTVDAQFSAQTKTFLAKTRR